VSLQAKIMNPGCRYVLSRPSRWKSGQSDLRHRKGVSPGLIPRVTPSLFLGSYTEHCDRVKCQFRKKKKRETNGDRCYLISGLWRFLLISHHEHILCNISCTCLSSSPVHVPMFSSLWKRKHNVTYRLLPLTWRRPLTPKFRIKSTKHTIRRLDMGWIYSSLKTPDDTSYE
jgi:hypothetical protein